MGLGIVTERYNVKTDFDFVEVGTCDWETLIQNATNEQIGLSIEPLKFYLDRLPNKNNVTKLNGALITEEMYAKDKELDVYYIDEHTLSHYGLGSWMKGCNSVGRPHDFHTRYYHDPGGWHNMSDEGRANARTVNLLEMNLVKHERVPCFTYQMIMEKFNIGHIKFLKTDTEGLDAGLLMDMANYYINNNFKEYLPKLIEFEDNVHSDKQLMIKVKEVLRSLNYTINDDHSAGHNSYARLQ